MTGGAIFALTAWLTLAGMFAGGGLMERLVGDPLPSASQIRIDVSESDAAYTVLAEVPGVGIDAHESETS